MNRFIKIMGIICLMAMFMGANYPATLDTDSNLYNVQSGQTVSPNHHNAIKDATKAIEGFVGTTNTTDPSTINYQVNHIKGREVDFSSKPRATMFIPAGSFIPTKLAGAIEVGQIEIGTNYKKTLYPLEFGDTANTGAQMLLSLPGNIYTSGGVELRPVYIFKTVPTEAQTVKFVFRTLGVGSGGDLDVVSSGSVTSTSSVPAVPSITKLYMGTWATCSLPVTADQVLSLTVERDITDTATANIYLLGVQIKYQVNKPDIG